MARHNYAGPEETETAFALLRSLLTPEQIKSMDEDSFIPVTGSKGGKFRIWVHEGHSGNIQYWAEWTNSMGKTTGAWVRYCAHLSYAKIVTDDEGLSYWYYFPEPDHWIAQMLVIETDETLFMNTAYED